MSDVTPRPAPPKPLLKGLTMVGDASGAVCDENGCEIPAATPQKPAEEQRSAKQ